MKLLSSLIACLALSACATDYSSQLSEAGFGYRRLDYSEGNVDPAMLMNGTYAAKQLNGPSTPLQAFCLSEYRCSRQSQLQSSGWDP